MPRIIPVNIPKNVKPVCESVNPWLFSNTKGNAPKNRYSTPSRIADNKQRLKHWDQCVSSSTCSWIRFDTSSPSARGRATGRGGCRTTRAFLQWICPVSRLAHAMLGFPFLFVIAALSFEAGPGGTDTRTCQAGFHVTVGDCQCPPQLVPAKNCTSRESNPILSSLGSMDA